jgi:Tfp pilus assembly protein FimT
VAQTCLAFVDRFGSNSTLASRALPLLTIFALTSVSKPVVAQSSGVNFASSGSYTAGSGAYALVAGDFNNDGKPDIVVVNNRSNGISVLVNKGGGCFSKAAAFPSGKIHMP